MSNFNIKSIKPKIKYINDDKPDTYSYLNITDCDGYDYDLSKTSLIFNAERVVLGKQEVLALAHFLLAASKELK